MQVTTDTLQTSDERPFLAGSPIRVLYVHGCGTFGGSSRSLITMIQAFPAGSVQPFIISPSGSATKFFREAGIPVLEAPGLAQFDNTQEGYYRGRRWLILLREICYLWPTLRALREARKWRPIDIIHVNDLLVLPLLMIPKLLGGPVVLHVRAVQQTKHARFRTGFVGWVVRKCCDAVVAIDATVGASLPAGVQTITIHNGFTPSSPKHEPNVLDDLLRPRSEGWLRIAAVGNLLPLKGVYELIEAARITKERGLRVEIIFVGDDTRDLRGLVGRLLVAFNFARNVRSDLEKYIRQHGLVDRVHLIGFTADVKQIYDRIDVLCFPSRHHSAGRPVFEAAYSRVPSIVALEDPRPDTLVPGETGLCIPPLDVVSLADAIQYFHDHRDEVRRMGENAYRLAKRNFDSEVNARQVLSIYQRLLAQPENAPAAARGALQARPGAPYSENAP